MSKKSLYEGPDISYHNGIVDIKRVRDAGCKRVAIRAGYGKNNVDQRYIANAQACYNLNVPSMIYWFSYGYTETMAVNEAEYAVAQAKKFWSKCPIAFDLEYDSVRYARTKGVEITKDLATRMAIAFLKRVADNGYIPVLYTNKDYYTNYFDLNKIVAAVGNVFVWYARYGRSSLTASESEFAAIWQYTSTGKLAGVNGNVDLNKFYTDFDLESVKVEQSIITKNINILNFQKAANKDGYRDKNGNKLVEDGLDGINTQYVRKQIVLKNKRIAFVTLSISAGEVVKWVQRRCGEILGIDIVITGEYDYITRKAVKEIQAKLNLAVDGVVGYDTIQALFYN